MVDVSNYDYAPLIDKSVEPEDYFLNLFINECFRSENKISLTWKMCIILDDKYKKEDLNKVITEQCQHLSTEERERIVAILRKFKDMSNGTLCMWNTNPLYLELKDDANLVCLRP